LEGREAFFAPSAQRMERERNPGKPGFLRAGTAAKNAPEFFIEKRFIFSVNS
jgi:hypothetical protein